MDRQQLRAILHEENIAENAYDLNGGHLSERYTIGEDHGTWFFYYSERGLESGRKEFLSESDACEHILKQLIDDSTTRIRKPRS